MQKRSLGQTGIEVSAIGLGTVKFGRNQAVKYPHAFLLPSDAELANVLAVAKDLGINLLDTAPAYGVSEERLGKLLGGERKDWVISTKAGEEFVDGQSCFDFSSQAILQSVERSLTRLRTDYLDIVLIHSNGDDQRLIEDENVFAVLDRLKQAGKIRAYGMSSKSVAGGLLTLTQADIAMIAFNVGYTLEREVIAYAKQNGKSILVKKALDSGHLPAPDALQFACNEPGVTSVIVGTINVDHLRENMAAVGSSIQI